MTKVIITHKWGEKGEITSSNGLIIPDCYNHSLKKYQELSAIAFQDFPFLKEQDIECVTVLESRWKKGHPAIYFNLPPNTKHKEYGEYASLLALDIVLSI